MRTSRSTSRARRPGGVTTAVPSAGTAPANGPTDEATGLTRLAELASSGNVHEARRLVKQLGKQWPDSERIRHWTHVLAPPVARVEQPDRRRSFAAEHAWLRAHAHDYPGCWVAVLGDRLLAADPDPDRVVASAFAQDGGRDALFHYQPGPEE